MQPLCSIGHSALPLVSTAIHAGHDLRPAVARKMGLDEATRLREEDPYTDRVALAAGRPIIVHRSRFEVDLNRPREGSVYTSPDMAWGLDVWSEALSEAELERSLALHDEFYDLLAQVLDELALQGPFVVLDLHSYNHRRGGPAAPPEPAEDNPEVNVGTGSLDRDRWGHVVDRFIDDLRGRVVTDHPLDVRENVRFRGGHLSRWVHERYDGLGCALAVELKKVFMDEWTGALDHGHLDQIAAAIGDSVPILLGELACGTP
jgi:N-formylglutamate deformylase